MRAQKSLYFGLLASDKIPIPKSINELQFQKTEDQCCGSNIINFFFFFGSGSYFDLNFRSVKKNMYIFGSGLFSKINFNCRSSKHFKSKFFLICTFYSFLFVSWKQNLTWIRIRIWILIRNWIGI